MLPKQTNYNVGIYLRLSNDDDRAGESVSIENQRNLLVNYAKEQENWNIHDIYVDDGISGTTFERAGVQRLLDDAKSGIINLILVKDLSRFGRNYIQVGQYIDYIFPMYNIRFIALNDNIDTLHSNSSSMDMLPIMNVFNEWHAANTSKKLRAIFSSNSKMGKYNYTYAAFGYFAGDDALRTPVIDSFAAPIVRRIFEMRAKGYQHKQIADVLNEENVITPSDYQYQRLNRPNPHHVSHHWNSSNVRRILTNPVYKGTLAQQRSTPMSYKNHKRIHKDESEWIQIDNHHEAIVSQELWNKVREIEKSVSRGKKSNLGEVAPLSGLLYCADCGYKMRQIGSRYEKAGVGTILYQAYICGNNNRHGKKYCSTHYIQRELLEAYVLADIRSMMTFTLEDEAEAKKQFLKRKAGLYAIQSAEDKKHLQTITTRITELDSKIMTAYEDKLAGKIPEEICVTILEKYQSEKKNLLSEKNEIEVRAEAERKDENDVTEFIKRLKCYANAEKITREMCLDLIEYITIDENNKLDKERPREIHIYYKLIDEKLTNKHNILTP